MEWRLNLVPNFDTGG